MQRAFVLLRSLAIAAIAGGPLAAIPAGAGSVAGPLSEDARSWLEDVKTEAVERGISQRTVQLALGDWRPLDRVIELDRRQPEFTQTFWSYLNRAVSEQRIARGQEMLRRYGSLLDGIQRRYGVQPRFLVAFWGLETNFGDHTGGFPVIQALATLAYDERRADFFRSQLFDALHIIDDGHITVENMTGSWAGAMGQVQFMPETFRRHAVDQDGDGRRDIWFNLSDAFGSAAKFLTSMGWHGDETWGREVSLPAGFDWSQADLEIHKPIREWRKLGVRTASGGALPDVDIEGAIILPGGYEGPAFLVYNNYDVILGWNRSLLYAVAVGHLADRIVGKDPLRARPAAADRPLSRFEIIQMQQLLTKLGFDPGTSDGVVGSQTRAALRAFQQKNQLPPDGYPTPGLLQRLRQSFNG